MKNYKASNGFFRLTDKNYTAHPGEQEYILMEGTQVQVLKVEEIQIKTSNWLYRDLNDRILTIIHLYHDGIATSSSVNEV